ncbi:MAG TPA: hypothetical protein VN437_08890 [Rectinemataceae bacterium]|nr:hypothetical protein [Rectinemataceae bacterium]
MALLVGVLASVTSAEEKRANPGQRYLDAASQKDISPFRRNAYLEIARLHKVEACLIAYGKMSAPPVHYDDPMIHLRDMGINAIPALVEALDDVTPAKMFHYDGHTMQLTPIRPYTVNELASVAICAAADREFVLDEGKSRYRIQQVYSVPEMIPQFRKLVLDWYAANRTKTLVQRMIEDVEDTYVENRGHAIRWIGWHKETAGREAVIKHVNRILDRAPAETAQALALGEEHPSNGPFGYLGAAGELAAAAVALGQIRGADSEATVRRICKEFSRCVEQYHFEGYDFRIDDLFEGYRGLIAIGKRDEAINELERLFKKFSSAMSLNDRDSYQRKLAIARKWTGDERDHLMIR